MTKRRIGRSILDALSGLPLFATAPLYRRWHLRWGATDGEVRGSMPGDEIVPKASFNGTRAVTIEAPPEEVWPWIVQIGYRRAGFYTYALLDNAGYESADRILGEYQHPKIGDWMPMAKKVNETTAFKVKAFEKNEWLVWEKPDSTWAWRYPATRDLVRHAGPEGEFPPPRDARRPRPRRKSIRRAARSDDRRRDRSDRRRRWEARRDGYRQRNDFRGPPVADAGRRMKWETP
jgi:hypothetical protein